MSSSHDCVRRVLTAAKDATITVVDGTDLVRESMTRTGAWPPAMIHLGQSLLGSTLLLCSLDREDTKKITMQWSVDGKFGNLFAESTQLGTARGTLLHPQAEAKSLETSLGEGILQVRRVSESGKSFAGIVKSVGNVSDDLVQYLESSEQRMCGVNLSVKLSWDEAADDGHVKVDSALGYLIDVLPAEGKETASDSALLKWDQIMRAMGKISDWALPEGDRTQGMLALLSGEKNPQEVFYQRLEFRCPCNQDRAERALAIMLDAEKNDPATEDPDPESEEDIRCEFCGKVYQSKSS